jgi:wyosine [tRNA(Phe)-imidazoG37] synthetase (radical SAM superfamily)
MSYSTIFGPVRSRRLGLSLGIDLMPHKTCTLNCTYCECGETTHLTLERKPYVTAGTIIEELDRYLTGRPRLDYITFGGSGEPTLNSDLGAVLAFCRSAAPEYRTALLTNATLFSLPDVREECLGFDLVLPSLDAASEEVFRRVNRPHEGLDVGRMIEGLAAFAKEYRGLLWVEIFVVPGVNDTCDELGRIKTALARIGPARVQLNALDRPAACEWVEAPSAERLQQIAQALLPLPVEILSRQTLKLESGAADLRGRETILATCSRRPCTVEELASLTGKHINETYKLLGMLLDQQRIATQRTPAGIFYRCVATGTGKAPPA